MWAIAAREKPRYLRALAIVAVLVSTGFMIIPQSANRGAAVTPVFTRPNVLVDRGPGSVSSASPGGPAIAAGSGGVLHAVWSDNRAGEYGVYYAHSLDGGATWTGEARIDGSVGYDNQAPSIATDTTGGMYNGNVYVAWQRGASSLADIYFTWSTDGGNIWNLRKGIDNAGPNNGSFIPRVAVDTTGIVYVAFYDLRKPFPDSNVYVARSEDGGGTFFPEVQVSSGPGMDAFPSIAAYGGTVYVAWQAPNSPGSNLLLGYSTNKGNNWIVNTIISFAVGGGDAHTVSITVDAIGVLHAAWIMVDAIGAEYIAYSQSIDKGATWRTFAHVDDVPASALFAPSSVTIVESSNIIYVVWADNRNGNSDIFASWSEDDGVTWGDGRLNSNDIRVDDTNDNAPTTDDTSTQAAPYAAPGPIGIYVIWSDMRDLVAYHAYFASFMVSELLITEIRDAPQGQEQVEIYNHGGVGIDLTGWSLIGSGPSISLTPLGVIAPGAYATIGDPPTSNLMIDVTFGDEGGIIQLRDQFGNVRESVGYGQLGPAPDPLDGESVARVAIGTGGYSNFWTRAVNPTFGSMNKVPLPRLSPPIVLNEVYFNAVNQNDRFIELYYRGGSSLNIASYVLAGDAPYTLPSVTLTGANPYYVMRPSQAPSLFNLLTVAGDNLYLYDQGGAFMDMGGWTTAHIQGFSMMRVPDGNGTADGYDDPTSIAAGWRFDQTPSLPLVLIGPKQIKYGNLGDRIIYLLAVTNKEPAAAYVNIIANLGAQGWPMTLYASDGVTPLTDSPGDADTIPDVGQIPPDSPVYIQAVVDIPPAPQAQDLEHGSVTANVAGDPLAGATAALTTGVTPYEQPTLSANPTIIWRSGLPPIYSPQESTITVNVTGRGNAIFRPRPQDTMLIIDATGSMAQNDPSGLRLTAAQHYVDLLSVPDRSATVSFNTAATLVNGHHLSSNYAQIKTDIGGIPSLGGTDLVRPIRLATDELIEYGNQSHVWVEIMLTDGDDTNGNSGASILAEAQRAAANGIVIFTIGLIGPGGFNEQLLMDVANSTGGMYLRAQSASDLDAIYQMIGRIVKDLAGFDNDMTDSTPMISVFLPQYISYVSGSANPPASYVGVYPTMTNIQWNVSKITINETWTGTFRVAASRAGMGINASIQPDSKATYIRYDDRQVSIPFPQVLIDVREPEPPRFNYTITRSPVMGIVTVDGFETPVPHTFSWYLGSNHTIDAPAVDNVGPNERWAFASWSDGGTISHNITVIAADLTFTASYYHQYRPSVVLQGLDGLHTVSAHLTAGGKSDGRPGNFGSWSDWVDDGSPLTFDEMSLGSNSTQRWKTLETFAGAPWASVKSPFDGLVVYWPQVVPTLRLMGLADTNPVAIRYTQFGTPGTSSSSSVWSGWVDQRSTLTVDGQVLIPPPPADPIERYMNMEVKGATSLDWTILNPRTHVVHYQHQYKPTVRLIGTDRGRNVSVFSTDNMRQPSTERTPGVWGNWSGWADAGSKLTFDTYTTGNPQLKAKNDTVLHVNSAFIAYIVYEPPPPPVVEPNFKPAISMIFVIILLAFGLYWGNKRPWDRWNPPPRKSMTPAELAAREADLKKKPIAEKLAMFNVKELQEKFARDRRWTMMMLAFPFAVVEGMIGAASFATGVFRVPDTGNWLSVGLLANTLLLVSGMVFDFLMKRHGYKVPGEEELAFLKEEDLPKTAPKKGAAAVAVSGKAAATARISEQIIGTLPAMQVWFAGFVIPRVYDLVFTDSRLVAIKSAAPATQQTDAAVAAGSLAGPAVAKRQYRAKDMEWWLNRKRANFDVPYSSIENIRLGGRNLLVKTPDRKFRVEVPTETMDSCQTVLRLSIPQYGMGLP